MTRTYSELLNLRRALATIADRPSTIAYAVARNLQRIDAIVKGIEKIREDLIDRFAERDADGRRVMFVVDGETGREIGPYEDNTKVSPGHIVMVRIAEAHREAFHASVAELDAEHHAFEPYTIDAEKIDGMTIEPWIVQTLLDTIIIETA